jgi:hypothetical protein
LNIPFGVSNPKVRLPQTIPIYWRGGLFENRRSVHTAANNNGPPRCNHNSASDHRSTNDRGAACSYAARAIDAARADDRARLHHAQGNEGSCQQ